MQSKRIIICALFLMSVFLCASAVSAASTGNAGPVLNTQQKVSTTNTINKVESTVTAPKKVGTSKLVGYTWDSYKVYYKNKYNQVRWYRCTIHYINYKNVYCNYAHSNGKSSTIQFRKSTNGRWYETDSGNLWKAMGYKTGTKLLYSSYNSWTGSTWLNWFNSYNKYTLKKAFSIRSM